MIGHKEKGSNINSNLYFISINILTQQVGELMATEIGSAKGLVNIVLELRVVLDHEISSLGVQWVVGIRFQEKSHETHKYVRDTQARIPLSTKNVKAHTTIEINVRMVNTGFASYSRGVVRVALHIGKNGKKKGMYLWYIYIELELGLLVQSVLGNDSNLKVQQILHVWPINFNTWGGVWV